MIALVLGCAENVYEDAVKVLEMCGPDAIFAVKDMMVRWPCRIDYGVTLHPDRTDGYLKERARRGRSTDFTVWAHRQYSSVTKHKTISDWAGSSGLFAVRIAKSEGFSAIVLAGVPMDQEYGHITRNKKWTAAKIFLNGWNKHLDELRPMVRSMSGWTKEVFGVPTPEWLAQHGSTDIDHKMVDEIRAMIEPISATA